MEENLKEKSIVKQVLTSEMKFIISLIAFVFGIVTPYFGIVKDIALIQASVSNINVNHEAHIQDLTQEIKDLRAEQVDLQKQIIAIIGNRKQ